MKSFTFYPSGNSFGIEYGKILILAFIWRYDESYDLSLYIHPYDVHVIGVDEL
jgi:hypothetical protein